MNRTWFWLWLASCIFEIHNNLHMRSQWRAEQTSNTLLITLTTEGTNPDRKAWHTVTFQTKVILFIGPRGTGHRNGPVASLWRFCEGQSTLLYMRMYVCQVTVSSRLLHNCCSLPLLLPPPLRLHLFHGWPHSSTPQPRVGATLCNAGGLWFSGLSKKSAKGKGRCTDGRLLVMLWPRSHASQSGTLVKFLFFSLPLFWMCPIYLMSWIGHVRGKWQQMTRGD